MTRYHVLRVTIQVVPPIQAAGRFDPKSPTDNQRFEVLTCTANVDHSGAVTSFHFGGRWLVDNEGREGASFYSDDPNLNELKAILRAKCRSAQYASETGNV